MSSPSREGEPASTARSALLLLNSVADTSGGSLRAAVNIAEAMAGGGVDVTFSAPVVRGGEHRTIDLMDQRVSRRMFLASPPVARFGGSLRQLVWLSRKVRDFDEVQVHSLFSLSAVYAVVLCPLWRVPVLLWPHGSLDPSDLRKHELLKRLIGPLVTRRILDRCAALLFTATRESRIAVTYGSATPHEVIALPVAPLRVEGASPAFWRKRHGIPPEAPVVLFLGRIDPKKRLPLLIETLSLLECRDAHLAVVGDGPDSERALAVETARRCGVTDRVHWTGWLEGEDRVEAFAAAAVFALLSEYENFGLSAIEALSAGCPTVISDGVFLAEDLVRAGAAVAVPRDAHLAAKAIDELLNSPEQAAALGERARELVAREFEPAAVAAALRDTSERSMVTATKKPTRDDVIARLYPEVVAGGYIRQDGFIDFYIRVQSLLTPDSVVLDFGAGRGGWNDPDTPSVFREVRDLRSKAARVVGVDVDPVVLDNTSLDEAHQIDPAGRIPFDDETFDLVLADYVFEHVDRGDAPSVAAELGRLLKPGGWLCARTPNKLGLIAIAARIVPNRLHVSTLRHLQPGRPAEDVFPTRYAMNTKRDLRRLFPAPEWTLVTYGHPGIQQYAGASALMWRIAAGVDRLTPPPMAPTLMVFARKNLG
ncbi:glycosyltransferase [Nocardioides immobilis]|uniref:Glycosyltransferase n=1 Tax=Nocardioides immobilis TaxID=2049295 RepID=A0A417XT46_9ACTN|nr:glycosyltransferase [Nocardioides immobilis]RHW23496.1 glycosyltransferase [Nocardioides immobilis]